MQMTSRCLHEQTIILLTRLSGVCDDQARHGPGQQQFAPPCVDPVTAADICCKFQQPVYDLHYSDNDHSSPGPE